MLVIEDDFLKIKMGNFDPKYSITKERVLDLVSRLQFFGVCVRVCAHARVCNFGQVLSHPWVSVSSSEK